MLNFQEKVIIKDRDDTLLGTCLIRCWVTITDSGMKTWGGEFLPIPGRSFDFSFPSIERSGLQVECEDGATAKLLTPIIEEALSSGIRCTFEGIWPPPRLSTVLGNIDKGTDSRM